ncbi:YgaP family membrane protein [Ancylobacter sp.]|uniref:YgaP family membrane protein n=1 Tax=Ancylobacter sp. TaxID=1872567 RepID=UPI003BAC2B0E
MTRNIGPIDKAVRIVLGLVLLSLIFVLQGELRWVGLIGVVPLLTALVGNCPLYSVLGLSTCSRAGRT